MAAFPVKAPILPKELNCGVVATLGNITGRYIIVVKTATSLHARFSAV
jgi:hypothetical protein